MKGNPELRNLPAVDELLRHPAVVSWEELLPRPLLVQVMRGCVASERARLLRDEPVRTKEEWHQFLKQELARAHQTFLQPVINATGVVLHTNLGRAPLSSSATEAAANVARGYSNLELDLRVGQRGSRHIYGETLMQLLTGAEAAMVVNNGAAAILLALSALAAGKEVVLSRGQMIEIGGSFRVPDVMAQSGCRLVEVGTTNRTHLYDYEQAITEQTGALLKVHTSNYLISGFTSEVSGRELSELAKAKGIPLIEDLGSGVLVDTTRFGLKHEPTVQGRIAEGVDVVTFSGDKLLGGPQAGFIVGRQEFIQRCKRHPLARAVRVGKLTLAALQATLMHYLRSEAETHIPVWQMCGLTPEQIGARARAVAAAIGCIVEQADVPVTISVEEGDSGVGGGSLPGETLPTRLISISGKGRFTPSTLARGLRRNKPPILARIDEGKLLLDLRTVAESQDEAVLQALKTVLLGA